MIHAGPSGSVLPRAGDVQLSWLVPGELPLEVRRRALTWLTEAERTRQRAFLFERNQLEYLATRALVRTELSRLLSAPPESWCFAANSYGRPELVPARGVRFNLSNHPTLVVCALRQGELEVGVDVEPVTRGAEVLGIARTVFSARELADLHALPSAQQPERALSLWTLKEAYIKARGMGLSLPLQEFSFVFSAHGAEIQFSPALQDDARRWRFTSVERRGHRIALAIEITPGAAAPQVHCAQEATTI